MTCVGPSAPQPSIASGEGRRARERGGAAGAAHRPCAAATPGFTTSAPSGASAGSTWLRRSYAVDSYSSRCGAARLGARGVANKGDVIRRRHKGVTHSITASHADAWHDQRSFYGAQSEVQSLFANRGARMPGTGSGGTLVHIVSGGQGCGATPARARIQASVRQRGKVDSMSMSHVQAGGQATKHGMLTAQVVVRREERRENDEQDERRSVVRAAASVEVVVGEQHGEVARERVGERARVVRRRRRRRLRRRRRRPRERRVVEGRAGAR